MASERNKKSAQTSTLPETINNASKAHLKQYQFKPGNVANPAGRPKGSRSKFAETFLKDFLADWEAYGISAIQDCREIDPVAYVRIAASIVPKELVLKDDEDANAFSRIVEQLNDEQLAELLGVVRALIARESARTIEGQVKT